HRAIKRDQLIKFPGNLTRSIIVVTLYATRGSGQPCPMSFRRHGAPGLIYLRAHGLCTLYDYCTMFFSLVKHRNANRFTFYRNLTGNFEPAAILPPAHPYLIQKHFLEGGTEIPWQNKSRKNGRSILI